MYLVAVYSQPVLLIHYFHEAKVSSGCQFKENG